MESHPSLIVGIVGKPAGLVYKLGAFNQLKRSLACRDGLFDAAFTVERQQDVLMHLDFALGGHRLTEHFFKALPGALPLLMLKVCESASLDVVN